MSRVIDIGQRGFSLLELAVAMVVLGLLLGGMLMPLAAQNDLRARQETGKALLEFRDALIGFALVHGRLPCPAVAATPSGVIGAGAEARNGSSCSCADATSSVASSAGVACAATADSASVTGVVPWATLGLPESDAWGRRYTYRINAKFGRDPGQTTFGGGCAPNPSPGLAGFALCTPATISVTAAAGGGATVVSNGVPAIVVSHGRNGFGAFTPQGSQIGGGSADEAENADGDNVFVSNVANDDQLTWIPVHVLMYRMMAAGMLP